MRGFDFAKLDTLHFLRPRKRYSCEIQHLFKIWKAGHNLFLLLRSFPVTECSSFGQDLALGKDFDFIHTGYHFQRSAEHTQLYQPAHAQVLLNDDAVHGSHDELSCYPYLAARVTTILRPARAQVLKNDDAVHASHVNFYLRPPTRSLSRAAKSQGLPVTGPQLNAPDHDRWAVSGRSVSLLVGRTRWFSKGGRICDRDLQHELVQHWLWVFDVVRAFVVHTIDRATGHAGRRPGGDIAKPFKALNRH